MDNAIDLVRQLDDAARRHRPAADLDSLFDNLLQAYSALSEGQRRRVRDAYNKCRYWATSDFWTEHRSPILQFKEDGGIDNLRRALAHYSLSDGYPDPRDAMVGMSDLRVVAARHGIDAAPVFSEMAAISNPDREFGFQSYMRAGGDRPTNDECELPAPGAVALVVYEAPDYQPCVVSQQPDRMSLRDTVQGFPWDELTFVVLRRDDDNWFEFSGSIEDGFSARYMEAGQEHVISQPPASISDGIMLLDLYVRGDDRWRTEYEWH